MLWMDLEGLLRGLRYVQVSSSHCPNTFFQSLKAFERRCLKSGKKAATARISKAKAGGLRKPFEKKNIEKRKKQ